MPRSHAFSRAQRRLHVFALNSDWFIALFAPVVIGQSNHYFGFGVYDTRLKTALLRRIKPKYLKRMYSETGPNRKSMSEFINLGNNEEHGVIVRGMKQSFSINRQYVAAIPRATLGAKKNIADDYFAGFLAVYGNQKFVPQR